MVLILSANDILQTISMKEAIVAVRSAFIDTVNGSAIIPKKSIIETPKDSGITTYLPSFLPRKGVLGLKVASAFRENPNRGLALVNSVIVLQDGKTGEIIAFMDGRLITAIKTGAATGVATDVLAKTESRSAGLIGAGYQAGHQVLAMCEVRPEIRKIDVFDIDKQKCRDFVKKTEKILSRFPARLIPVETPEEAVKEKDIVITVTSSATPVFDGRCISEGVHINAVGSFTPHMQEIDEITIARADKVVTSIRDDALERAGDLIAAIRKGTEPKDIIYGELGEILIGKKPGRESDNEITIFESMGLSTLDISVAAKVYQNSLRYDLGHQMSLD
jgi:ornithine cyclodeaminase